VIIYTSRILKGEKPGYIPDVTGRTRCPLRVERQHATRIGRIDADRGNGEAAY